MTFSNTFKSFVLNPLLWRLAGFLWVLISKEAALRTLPELKDRHVTPKRERNRFYRGNNDLRDLVESLWKSGEHYLGEWHSHPGGLSRPSGGDVRQMKAIAKDHEAHCPEPILVVISEDGGVAVRVFPIGEAEVQLLPGCSLSSRGVQSDDTDR